MATTSSSAPAWARVTVTTTRSGRSPISSRTAPTTSPVAWLVTGWRERALANAAAAHPADEVNRMSSDRR